MREDVIRAHAELRVGLRAHPPAAPGGRHARPQGDAPHLHARALPGPRRADPRARARTSRSRPTSSSASRGRPRRSSARRSRSVEEVGYDGAFTFIFSPRRGTDAAGSRTPSRTRRRSSACSGSSRSSSAAPASARSASSAARSRCSSRARRAPTRAACAAARATTRSSTSPASPRRATYVDVDDPRGDQPDAHGRAGAACSCPPPDAAPSVRPPYANICSCAGTGRRSRTMSRRGCPGHAGTAVVRRFDAPEALDTRFYEVRAKSRAQPRPGGLARPVPRGRSTRIADAAMRAPTALAGDTPVLMADGHGRARSRSSGRATDLRDGAARRLPAVRADRGARPLDQSIKPAYPRDARGRDRARRERRSPLPERTAGWKHVTGAEQGALRAAAPDARTTSCWERARSPSHRGSHATTSAATCAA